MIGLKARIDWMLVMMRMDRVESHTTTRKESSGIRIIKKNPTGKWELQTYPTYKKFRP
jgi:hypothetical protein